MRPFSDADLYHKMPPYQHLTSVRFNFSMLRRTAHNNAHRGQPHAKPGSNVAADGSRKLDLNCTITVDLYLRKAVLGQTSAVDEKMLINRGWKFVDRGNTICGADLAPWEVRFDITVEIVVCQ